MLKNYFLIAFRGILHHKFYAGINVLGLALGIAISFFIALYILDELSYDRFNENIDRMYRLGIHGKIGGDEVFTANTAPVVAGGLKSEIPEVKQVMRIESWDQVPVRWQEKSFVDDNVCIVDSNFFNFFSYHLLKGNPNTVLSEPMSVVLTSHVAQKLFGSEEPVGKMISIGNDSNFLFKVTGIATDAPGNSHLKFNYLISMMSYKWMYENDKWLNNYLDTYFIVYPGSDMKKIRDKLDDLVVNHVGPELSGFLGISTEQFFDQQGIYKYLVIPVKDIHLYSKFEDELEPTGNISLVYIFSAIGLFIILIASINFMNLATARAANRAREVGLRKTFGSLRSQLIGQFMSESIIFSLVSMFLSMLIILICIPYFNEIAGKSVSYSVLFHLKFTGVIVGISLLIGILSGIYPAFYLTRFRISEVVKGEVSRGMKGKKLRGILVVVQFSISILMIICTLLVYQQLQYTRKKDLGFNKEQVLVIPNMNMLGKQKSAFKEALMKKNNIIAASYCSNVIPGYSQMTIFRKPGEEQDFLVSRYWADYEQVKVMGFQLLEGRDFSRDFPSDSTAILVNQALVKQFGFENPVGQEIISFTNDNQEVRLRIIGVLKDFNYESLRQEIRPLIINLANVESMMAVRFSPEVPVDVIKEIASEWKNFIPGEPFKYSFLDQNFDAIYHSEQNMGKLITLLTFFAIFIACMGLFGLSTFTAEQRTREIGIRKAMGASVTRIIRLISKEYALLILISFLISITPAWYFMSKWLSGFAYRIEIGFGVFIISGLLALIIAIISIGYQSLKAARINPADSLRYE